MHFAVNIPEELVTRLRAGALDVLLAPIMESVEGRPCGVLSSRSKRACALLDVIGWHSGEAGGEEVLIDMIEHAPALHDALSYALKDALRDLREAERTDALMTELDREAVERAHRSRWPARRLVGLCGRLAGSSRRSSSPRRSVRRCHIA
jgi:hypothetical protein